MATLYSTQGVKIRDAATTYAPIDVTEAGGRLRSRFFSYTNTGSEATNDIVRLVKVPKGAKIHRIFLQNEAMATTAYTIEIGDSADTDRLVASVAKAAAASTDLTLVTDATTPAGVNTDNNPLIGYGYVYGSETWIEMKLITVTTPTANAVFRGHIEYTVD